MASLTKVTDVRMDADTEVEFIESDGSDSDTPMIGNNPLRSEAGNARSEMLREYLKGFTTEAEKIKGHVYSKGECEKR